MRLGARIGKAAGEHGMLSCLTSVQPSHPNDPAIDSAHAATADRAAVINTLTRTRADSADDPVTANHPRSIRISVAGWSSHIVRYQCGSAKGTRTFKSSSASFVSHGEFPPSTARIHTNVNTNNQTAQRRRRRVKPTFGGE